MQLCCHILITPDRKTAEITTELGVSIPAKHMMNTFQRSSKNNKLATIEAVL